MEIWKTAVCYTRNKVKVDIRDRYEVSSYGRVRNVETGDFISPQLTGNPEYFYVNLQPVAGKRKLVRVNLLMAQTFLGLPEDLSMTCDHEDRNKYNNSLWNLRWACKKTQMRNRDLSILPTGENLLVIKDELELSDGDYIRLRGYISSGQSLDKAKESLLLYNKRGGDYQETIVHRGIKHNLYDWCTGNGLVYKESKMLLSKGYSSEQVYLGLDLSLVDKTFLYQGMCYPSRTFAKELTGLCERSFREHLKRGTPILDMKTYNRDRHKVLIDGMFLTKEQHCKRNGTSLVRVETIMRHSDKSFQEALRDKPKRIIKHTINGVVKRNREWFEHFNLKPKAANNYMARHGSCLRTTLEYYGVDTSAMEIVPYF